MSQIILLERVDNLGDMGDVVTVKPGYARNFLLPQGKALRATKDNVAYFESQKKDIEANSAKHKKEAEATAKKLDGTKVALIRQASERGQLYGSVSARDIADAVNEKGFSIERNQVAMLQNYKLIGLFDVPVTLHPEVKVSITINIARSKEEAEIQQKTGRALIAGTDEDDAKDTRSEQKEKVEERTDDMKQDLLDDTALKGEEVKAKAEAEEAEKERRKEEAKAKKEAETKAKAEAETEEETSENSDNAETSTEETAETEDEAKS